MWGMKDNLSAFQLELDALESDQPAQQQALHGQPPQEQKDNKRKLSWTPLRSHWEFSDT